MDRTISYNKEEFVKCQNDPGYWMETYCLANGQPIVLSEKDKEDLKAWAARERARKHGIGQMLAWNPDKIRFLGRK